jgi:FkbM family methyltransferase
MKIFIKLGIFIAKKLLQKSGLRITRPGPYGIFDFESFLCRHIEVHGTLSFIQIGANDGVMNDPIFKFIEKNKNRVSGFVLEPLPDIFSTLVTNYQSFPKIKPLNLAIHNSETEMLLYRVKSEHLSKVPAFARGIASFDPNHWKKTSLVPNPDYIESEIVKCISYSQLLRDNEITKIDLLLIDTEGYDYDILSRIDFGYLKPRIIRFEHGVRDQVMSESNFIEIAERLNRHGYQIIAESYDATAYLLDPKDLIF